MQQIHNFIESLLGVNCRRIISIEGNIGAGKSTLLEKLKTDFAGNSQVIFMQEPVDEWSTICNEQGATILSCFYADSHKYAFPFQVMAYISRLNAFQKIIRDHPECEVIVCERSLEADRNIFAKMMRDDGAMEPMVFQVYEMMYRATSEKFCVDTVLYLDVDPATCLTRIAKRGREGELNIPLSYLEKCKAYYDTWLETYPNVITVDANIYTPDDILAISRTTISFPDKL